MERQDLRALQERIQRQGLHVHRSDRVVGHQRIAAHAGHLERASSLRHAASDLPQTHDPDRLPPELAPHELGLVPLPAMDRSVRHGNVPHQPEQEAEHELHHGHGVRAGHVQNVDSPLLGGGDVDVVESGAGTSHPAQLRRGLDQAARDLGRAAHDPGIDVGDERHEIGLAKALTLLDRQAGSGAQQGDRTRGERIADENAPAQPTRAGSGRFAPRKDCCAARTAVPGSALNP
jgi:hypothetical protein